MADLGIDLTADAGEISIPISWHEPHPRFAIVFVGQEETPFGIHRDLLCAQSSYFRDELSTQGQEKVEYILNLPDTTVEVFGCFQCFIYTSQVYDKRGGKSVPEYTLLLGVWKLANKLRMATLREAVLNVMYERRQSTGVIPGIEFLKTAWKDTEEGSKLRDLLISWTAEHMRTSPEMRNEFAHSLPQEILSELVIVMSASSAGPTPRYVPHKDSFQPSSQNETKTHPQPTLEVPRPTSKRGRKPDIGGTNGAIGQSEAKPAKKARKSDGPRRPYNRTSTTNNNLHDPSEMSPENDMAYCRDLIQRMVSGPGFWTRLVKPFKEPVDPVRDGAPRYFDVVKRPMSLRVIKEKMASGQYANSAEFEADIRLIFQNCFEYWTPQDQVFKDCEAFERYFNEKWSTRHKWAPTIKSEAID